MKKLVLLFLFISISPVYSHSVSAPSTLLNDYTGLIPESERVILEAKLLDVATTSNIELMVAIIPEIEGETIELFTKELFYEWGVGDEREGRGALVGVLVTDGSAYIEIGQGLKEELTDIEAKAIIDSEITPSFQRGDYYLGISQAVDKLVLAAQGEYTPETNSQKVDYLGLGVIAIIAGAIFILIRKIYN